MKIILVFLFLTLSQLVFGQKKYTLNFTNSDYKTIKKNIPQTFEDSIDLIKFLKNIQNTAIKKGYLLASFDSIHFQKKTFTTQFRLGQKFGKAHLTISEENLWVLKESMNINEKFIRNVDFTPLQISNILKTINNTLENNGYPFASVFLTNPKIEGIDLTAEISISKKQYYEWTKIHLKGDNSISDKYITNLIGIKLNTPFNQSEFKKISKRLKQANFITEIKPAEILFTQEGVELFLYLKSNPISSVNGVIGFQPNPITNRLNLTGDLSLKLVNVIKRGELLDLNWKSIQDQTQSLQTKLNYPFLFNTNFGLDGTFNLYKLDSSFLELKSSIGVQYFMKGGNYIKMFYQNISSNIISQNAVTNSMGNVSTNNYGIAISKRQFDYLPNPTNGFSIHTEVSIGSRKSNENDTSSTIISTTYRSEFLLEWIKPIHKRHIFYFSNHSNFYFAPVIFQNEVERFGGQTSQRGFNEQELFATTKTTSRIEYRYLVDKNSRAFLFFDQTWYENNAVNYYKDTPLGFGAGFSFGTNIGVFSLSYALGKQFDNPVLLRDGKIHFGYTSFF